MALTTRSDRFNIETATPLSPIKLGCSTSTGPYRSLNIQPTSPTNMSLDDHDSDDEENIAFVRHLHPRYEGEDCSPVTKRELNGWLAYPIAAEVFAIVGVGAFLPVILEQLARENGVLFNDRTQPCISRDPTELSKHGNGTNNAAKQCIVKFLGTTLTTSSFAMYTFATSVLVQAVTLISLGLFADYGPNRKKMLMGFTYTGSLASAMFIFITPSVYFIAPFIVIIGVTSLGCSFVLLNAFLPLLVANHPEDNASKSYDLESLMRYEIEALQPTDRVPKSDLKRDQKLSAKISSKGVGYGYMSAVGVQILSILILWGFSKTSIQKSQPSLPIRFILLLIGIWWAVFSIPTMLWLQPRPRPSLPTQCNSMDSKASKLGRFWFYTSFSLRSFWTTLVRALSLRQTAIFLVAWFLLSDAVATISGTAVLFARTELQMGTIAIAVLSVTSISCGVVGALLWPRVQERFSLQPKTVLLCCIFGMEIIPLYGLLGFLPFIRKLGFIGLQQPWEIYPIAVIHGIVMGGISSYARSVYAPLIPEGKEAAFFALYAVTDKGSSAVGPALVGWIVDRVGSIRPAFIFLAVVVVLPAPLLWFLNVEKGREDSRAMTGSKGLGQSAYVRVADEQN